MLNVKGPVLSRFINKLIHYLIQLFHMLHKVGDKTLAKFYDIIKIKLDYMHT